jgi:hypothetical protein
MDQQNPQPKGALPDAIPSAPFAPFAPSNLMAQLMQAITVLVDVSRLSLANNLSRTKVNNRSAPFRGEHGNKARQFLAAFTMWVWTQGTAINTMNHQ